MLGSCSFTLFVTKIDNFLIEHMILHYYSTQKAKVQDLKTIRMMLRFFKIARFIQLIFFLYRAVLKLRAARKGFGEVSWQGMGLRA